MTLARRTAATAVLGLALAAQATGQQRRGFWAEAGSGLGSIRVACSGCADLTRASGSSGYIRLGIMASRRVLVGLEAFSYVNEAFAFAEDDPKSLAEVASAGIAVLWFPGRSGAFLKGGLGVANGEFIVEPASDQEVVIQGTGVGLSFGVGYDLPLRRWLALSANAGAFVTGIGDLVLPASRVEDVIATLYQLSFGITIR